MCYTLIITQAFRLRIPGAHSFKGVLRLRRQKPFVLVSAGFFNFMVM